MTAARYVGFALSALALPSTYAFADGSGVSESGLGNNSVEGVALLPFAAKPDDLNVFSGISVRF